MSADVEVTNMHRGELPPLLIPPDEMGGGGSSPPAGEAPEEEIPEIYCTPEQVKTFLRVGYKIGAWKTGYGDIWAVTEDELDEIATRIAPDINRLPFVAKAVAYGDQKSGWALLVYSFASRILLSIRRKRAELAKEAEEDHGQEPADDAGAIVTEPDRVDGSARSRFVIP